MATVAFATCAKVGGIDPQDLPLKEALEGCGIGVVPLVWNDPSADWSRVDACLIRSTWDYCPVREEFVAWARRVERVTALWNPSTTVEWNTHKSYLSELAAAGIPTVPTRFLPRGSALRLGELLDELGWVECVLKPAVSADAAGAMRFTSAQLEAGQAHANQLLALGDALLQPYLPSVETWGERSTIFISGVPTHAVKKPPVLSAAAQRKRGFELVPLLADDLAVGQQVLDSLPCPPPLYARVDLARDGTGRPCVMEVELVEPSLFFGLCPSSALALANRVFCLVAGRTTAA